MSETTGTCKICRKPLGPDGHCRACDEAGHVWSLGDWRPLAELALIIVLGFSFTRLVVTHYQQEAASLSQQYSAEGDSLLAAHRPAEAVKAYESALAYSPDERHVRLNLGDALLESGFRNEAMAQIRDLWEQRPDDASVNLKLARLEAVSRQPDLALVHYRNAIEGVWTGRNDQADANVSVRLETAEYLIALGRQQEAESVLISAEESMPGASTQQPKLAELFLSNGDAPRSRMLYQLLLVRNHVDRDALLGAARASFLEGNYNEARRYLDAIHPPSSAGVILSRDLEAIEALDPFAPGATPVSRAERTIAAYRIARQRLDSCDASIVTSPLRDATRSQWAGLRQWAAQLEPLMTTRKLRGRDDVIESAMRFAFQAETSAEAGCSQPNDADEHLMQLGRQRLGAIR
jgi:Flp pilus assembly protein TadD